jgi:hypothetical protein
MRSVLAHRVQLQPWPAINTLYFIYHAKVVLNHYVILSYKSAQENIFEAKFNMLEFSNWVVILKSKAAPSAWVSKLMYRS